MSPDRRTTLPGVFQRLASALKTPGAERDEERIMISAVSHYRGGTLDEVEPLARTLKAIYAKYGVGYRLSCFQTGPNKGDWFAVVTYADTEAYERALKLFPQDAQLQEVFVGISKFAERISREIVTDLDL